MTLPIEHVIGLSTVLFTIGVIGAMTRRNLIVVLMSIELMLNAANLTFVGASRQLAASGAETVMQGPIFALFVILVAAAEAAVGLALVIALYRLKQTVSLEAAGELKG